MTQARREWQGSGQPSSPCPAQAMEHGSCQPFSLGQEWRGQAWVHQAWQVPGMVAGRRPTPDPKVKVSQRQLLGAMVSSLGLYFPHPCCG